MKKNVLIKKYSIVCCLFLIALFIVSCNNNNSSKNVSENTDNSHAEKLINEAKNYLSLKDPFKADSVINIIIEKYPNSDYYKSAVILQDSCTLLFEIVKKEKEEKIAETTKNLLKKYDEFKELTYYYDKTSPQFVNMDGFFAYIVYSGNVPYLRLVIQYENDDWLFIERFIIKVDDKTFEITENEYGEIKTDNSGGRIWEWIDRLAGAEELELIKAISKASSVKIRFNGKDYYDDVVISKLQILAFKNILDAYEALGGKI